MGNNNLHTRWRSLPILCAAGILAGGTALCCLADEIPEPGLGNTQQTRNAEKIKHHEPDFTAKKRMGKASFYANEFAGRTMADGAPMDPHGDNAASKTLPLGTTAKVTNLETGKSAVVTIQDRGPYVPGRIVDLSPATAKEIGISRRQGVALVVVAPIAVPQPNGRIKLGSAAREPLSGPPVREAIRQAALDTRTAQR